MFFDKSIEYRPLFFREIDDVKDFKLFCFIWQTERKDLLQKPNQILPNFSKKSVKNQCEILLHGINLNALCPDPRNNKIMFAFQKVISKTNFFSKHYEWYFSCSFNSISYHPSLISFILLHHNQSQIPPILTLPPNKHRLI